MNDNIQTPLKALAHFEIFLQSMKLRFCEAKMPIFGVKWGGVRTTLFFVFFYKLFPFWALSYNKARPLSISRV